MTIFPTVPEYIPAQASTDIGRVPAFDGEANRFLLLDGALAERSGREAVQQWFDLALRQQPGRVPIYRSESSRQYGISRAILGEKLPSGYAVAELERSVRETASFCPAVREIQDFSATRRGRTCQVSFTAVLYTEETLEVSVDV